MKATIDVIKRLRDTTGLKVNRNFGGFFADRLVQAFSRPNLVDAIEHLAKSLDSGVEYVGGKKTAAFMAEANGEHGPAILQWMRQHPKVVAMIAGLRDDDEYQAALDSIELPTVAATDSSVVSPGPAYDVTITAYCQSGIAHGADSKAGNATLYRRRSVMTESGQQMELPVYAGNAIRGRLRDLLADHLIHSLGLTVSRSKPSIELWAFHVLYAGGVLEANSKADADLGKSGAIRTDGMRDLRDHLPMLSMLGTAIGNRVISGRVYVGDLRPRCREWGSGEQSADELMGWEFLTRRDDYEGRQEDDDHAGMIATTEVLKPGTVLDGGIDIDEHANDIERACLGRALWLLQAAGRYPTPRSIPTRRPRPLASAA